MKKKIFLLVLLCGIAAGAYYGGQWYQNKENTELKSQSVTAFGNVDIRQVDLGFRVEGRVQQVLFDEGDTLKAGDMIAVLDKEPFEENLALQQAQFAVSQAECERMHAGYRSQDVQIARSAVAESRITLRNLETEFRRRKTLVDEGGVTRQSYDDIRARRDEAAAKLDSALQQLALMEEGFRKEDIAKADAQVESGKAQIEIARTRLDDTRLYAPSAGTVLTRVLEPGAIARVGETVLTLSIADPAWVRAYISETDLGRIAPGMKAEVVIDSRPDRPFSGRIGFISPKAEFTPKNVETQELRTRLVYRFRVIVDNPDESLRQGMPVTVKLLP